MSDTKSFQSGMTSGVLLMVAAQGGHWFITPANHPNASALLKAGVAAQVIISLGASLWLMRREKRSSTPAT